MWERQAAPILFQLREHGREADLGEREILDDEPEMDAQMGLVLEAWQELDSCRPLGFAGAGKIPITDVYQWALFNGVDYELTAMVIGAIRILDSQRAERIASEHAHNNGG